jgi:hypothetical protein
VKRQKGKYLVTALGRVVYNAQTNLEPKIENALNNYWKLKALDSLELSSRQDRNKVISELIDDEEIRRVLAKEEPNLAAQAAVKKTRDSILTVTNQL